MPNYKLGRYSAEKFQNLSSQTHHSMKTYLLLGAGMYLLSNTTVAQSKLIFDYDTAGNQVKYSYCKGKDCDTQTAAKEAVAIVEETKTFDDLIADQTEDFKVYPNPTQHMIYADWSLEGNPNLTQVEILDISGKTVNLEFVKTASGTEVSLSNLSKGVYFIKFSFDDQAQITRKILKN